jgi:Flp pilus assembly CpaF family ATPase
VFVARRGRSELTTTVLGAGELVERMLRTSGRRIDTATPFVDAMLSDVTAARGHPRHHRAAALPESRIRVFDRSVILADEEVVELAAGDVAPGWSAVRPAASGPPVGRMATRSGC